MSESVVCENPSVVVGDQHHQQRPDTVRYHQTVTTDPAIYHQYRADVNQNKTLPHPHFPILLPQPHHIGHISEPSRDILINYNISHYTHYHNNILCLACSAKSDQLREIQQHSESPQYGAMSGDKPGGVTGVRPQTEGGLILYNSHLIRQLRSSENLVCDV